MLHGLWSMESHAWCAGIHGPVGMHDARIAAAAVNTVKKQHAVHAGMQAWSKMVMHDKQYNCFISPVVKMSLQHCIFRSEVHQRYR